MNENKRLPARFFESETGAAPVRDWLLSLGPADRKAIGDDIRTAEFGWPIGMPLCRSIKGRAGLWEIRSTLPDGRIARVFFCAHKGSMVLLRIPKHPVAGSDDIRSGVPEYPVTLSARV
ncbi:MAG: hypothetical protein Tsb0019_40240 [Roseibium sp.]